LSAHKTHSKISKYEAPIVDVTFLSKTFVTYLLISEVFPTPEKNHHTSTNTTAIVANANAQATSDIQMLSAFSAWEEFKSMIVNFCDG